MKLTFEAYAINVSGTGTTNPKWDRAWKLPVGLTTALTYDIDITPAWVRTFTFCITFICLLYFIFVPSCYQYLYCLQPLTHRPKLFTFTGLLGWMGTYCFASPPAYTQTLFWSIYSKLPFYHPFTTSPNLVIGQGVRALAG